jgi:hypothetical protein|tara:strand:+ start:740 stop:1027 length:288 start_codon:yes stop_codon:yes gene_type:complete
MEKEIKLWQSVVIQGLMDSLNKFFITESRNDTYQIMAKEWLNTSDFKYCCELANLKPDKVLKVYDKFYQYKKYITAETTKVLLNEAFGRSKQLCL